MENINDENARYSCNIQNQEKHNTYTNSSSHNCLMIGSKAPEFSANTTFGECKLSDYKRKMACFFLSPRRSHASMYNRIYCI